MERVGCVELAAFLADEASAEARAACAEVARSLEETGIVILCDPRVSEVRRRAGRGTASEHGSSQLPCPRW
jgi:hypothetical protein